VDRGLVARRQWAQLPLALFVVLCAALPATLPAPALAASEADEACRAWYEEQAPDEQAREDNEAQIGTDVDGDGCTGILAAPDSDGPVEGALEVGGVRAPEKAETERLGGAEEPQESTNPEEQGVSPEECRELYEEGSAEEQVDEDEERQFGVDDDGDGCIGTEPTGEAVQPDGTPVETPEETPPADAPEEEGGLSGMVLGFFTSILQWVWDHTFGWMLENMASAFRTNLLPLPDLEAQGDVVDFYKASVEKMRPAVLVGILLLGILMMLNTPNYDLAYAGFSGLPKLMGVAMAMAFLPQFMGQLGVISGGLSDAFFPSGSQLDGAGFELFKAAVGNLATTNFLNVIMLIGVVWVGTLVIVVALLKNILYVLLFLAAPFALVASLFPGLNSLAGSWFRGVVACAAIPALWSTEIGVGTLILRSPETLFGDAANAGGWLTNSVTTSLGAILIMWIMYKTPFKVIEWAFNVHLPNGGGLSGLVKAVAVAAATTPVRQGISNLMNRGAAGGAVKTVPEAAKANSGTGGAGPRGAEGMARKIQQAQRQQGRSQATHNAVKSIHKYLKDGDPDRTPTRRSAPGGRRADINPGLGRRGRANRSSETGR
jgi:uncharacterized protein (DUF983 family)